APCAPGWLPAATLFLWLLYGGAHNSVQQASRRLCNLSYVFFSLACAFSLLLVMRSADQLFSPGPASVPRPLRSLSLLSRHALSIFLLGNVLTGLVNLLAAPLDRDAPAALGLLLAYGTLLAGAAVTLGRLRSAGAPV
ncbi:hypothetical protein EON64_13610, partial [archaeon]